MVFSMKKLRVAAMAACMAGMGLGLSACGSMDKGKDMTGAQLSKPDKNIVEIATGSNMGDVSTLVTLVKAAGLVETLETPTGTAPAPFTVFAPTNEAFDTLKKEHPDLYAKVTDPANKAMLKNVLLYHVIPGKIVMSTDIMTMSTPTADGTNTIAVMKNPDGSVTLNNGAATVIKTDIVASNGVIHWIDHVLLPPDGGMPAPMTGH
jgi:uncharacterized surface protein with fasciclin (FAS1) repeats